MILPDNVAGEFNLPVLRQFGRGGAGPHHPSCRTESSASSRAVGAKRPGRGLPQSPASVAIIALMNFHDSRSSARQKLWYGVGSMTWAVGLLAQTVAPGGGLHELSFEELGSITVTTASRKEEPLFQVPAAISVIESGEIARLGVTRLVDVLRIFPGVHVAQINPAAWGVAIRGFNSQDSRKLLVLRDGRSVYDTLFSGVWWDVQDPLLDDIAQIEVVRGPGGSLWGANAVNGVINIISKPARDTLGTRVAAVAEDDGSVVGSWRHGWVAGERTHVRVSVQGRQTEDTPEQSGGTGQNGLQLFTAALRLDHGPTGTDEFTLFANLHQGGHRQALTLPILTPPYQAEFRDDVETMGGSLHGRWNRKLDRLGQLTLQGYYDYFERGPVSLDQRNHTLDFDLKHTLPEHGPHRLVWGAGYRLIADQLGSGSDTLSFDPASRWRRLFNAFGQDEIIITPDKLRLTIGARVEHNDYSGWEVQPSARILWTPTKQSTWWAGVSRAVRTPDRTADFRLRLAMIPPANEPGSLPTEVIFQGNPALKSESLIAYEAGLRWRVAEVWQAEVSLFANDYDELVGFTFGGDGRAVNPARNLSNLTAANNATGRTWGGEVSVSGEPRPGWRLTGNFSYLRMDLAGSGLPFLDNGEGQYPSQMATVRSSHELASSWRLDLTGRYVAQLAGWNVPAYVVADVQLVWKYSAAGQLLLSWRNLGSSTHYEAPPGRNGTAAALVPRVVGIGFNHAF